MDENQMDHHPPGLYPPIEPYNTGFLSVSDIHTIYYEQSGNEIGNPIVVVHGGPGCEPEPIDRCFFDPKAYRIILFHQRGVGQSTPYADLRENTTWDLVDDMEKLRKHLKVEKWVVFGGSWGSTVSLAYSQSHPECVKALILRGIFTLTQPEIEWLCGDKGLASIFPDQWERFTGILKEEEKTERKAMLDAYFFKLTSKDSKIRDEAVVQWSDTLFSVGTIVPPESLIKSIKGNVHKFLPMALLGCYYFKNEGFFSPNQLINNLEKIKHIPTSIVHGRYDMICPISTAWKLHKLWPEAEFVIAPDAGHFPFEPSILVHLVKFCDKYRTI